MTTERIVRKRTLIGCAVRIALLASTGMTATISAVQAQDPTIQEIVVTGSHIRLRDYESISPVTTVSADAISSTGRLSVEEVLNRLPQVVPGFTASSNNPADGTSTVDLRGIGTERTLVLINGRRLTPTTQYGVTDLNNVPVRLIDRIEVVTGGASAVYGSDALAGVVNFILKDDYEGFDVGYQFGQSGRSDGEEKQIDALLGGNFADDRGNITAFASWYKRDSVLQSAREFSRIDLSGNGSATGNARLPNVVTNPFPTVGAFLGGNSTSREYAFNTNNNGGLRIRDDRLPETDGNGTGDRYNFPVTNFLLTPAERINLGAFGHLKLSDQVTAYMDVMYVDSRNANQLAPTPATVVPFDPNSTLLSDQARALLDARPDPNGPGFLTRRMVEVGARLQQNNSKLQQITVGLRGSLPVKDWAYDVYYEHGKNDFTNITHNDVSRSKFSAGISGCPAAYKQFVPTCVPVQAFGVESITPAMADFIRLDFTDSTVFERNMVSAVVNGSLVDLPAGPLGFALGLEYREDSSDFVPDLAKKQGDILGFNAAQPVNGKFDVKEVFVELGVPLLSDLPAVNSLSLDTGVRYSDYSSIGKVASYKAGLDWSPVSALHVRGMYQRAVRAPSVFELFQAGDQGFPQIADPCASRLANGRTQTVSADTAAFCKATWGIDSATYAQGNAQVESFFYGNPTLGEETSDTYTFGIAMSPEAIPGLQLSVDYYDIRVKGYVNALEGGPTGIVLNCYASGDINSKACFSDQLNQPLVYRDAVGDLKTRVPIGNLSALESSGVDASIAYPIPLPFATGPFGQSLDVQLLVTWLGKWKLDDVDYAGTIGAYNIDGAFPKYKGNVRFGYRVGPVSLSYNLQYIDAMDNQGNIPAFEDGGYVGVKSTIYQDLSAQWSINNTLELNLGVRNLADVQPKFFDVPIDQNTDPSTYDTLGRFYFGSLRAKF